MIKTLPDKQLDNMNRNKSKKIKIKNNPKKPIVLIGKPVLIKTLSTVDLNKLK